MSAFNFPSIADPDKYGYRFDNLYSLNHCGGGGAQVDESCLFFETYGDGMTQHSREYPIPYERAADYFASLAAFLLENPQHCDCLIPKFGFHVDTRKIDFAATVVYREPKDGKPHKCLYYSMEERKVTTADKRNDRRYEQVESWMDGGPEAIIRLIWQSYYSRLETFMLSHAVRDWTHAADGRGWMETPFIGDKRYMDREMPHKQNTAWKLLRAVVEHLEGLRIAKGNVKNWLEQLEFERSRALAPAEASSIAEVN